MSELQTVVSFVVAGVLGGIGLWWSSRNLRRAGLGDVAGAGSSRAEAIENLQIVADTWEERYNLEVTARVTAETALAKIIGAQALERELAAQCRSDLDDARNKIRSLERHRGPRGDE